jgi:hypothetical protein
MNIRSPINKFAPSDSNPNATAKNIREISWSNRSFERILLRIISCFEKARRWDDLSPTGRIMLELEWADSLLALLSLGNFLVTRSIRYRLREQTPEEDELENAV